MCLACEEEAYFFRLWCGDFLSRGEMPPGVTEEELQAMGLPLPDTAAKAKPSASTAKMPANAFACDSPGE